MATGKQVVHFNTLRISWQAVCVSTQLDHSHKGGAVLILFPLRNAPCEAVQSDKLSLIHVWCNQSSWAFLLHLSPRIWVTESYCLGRCYGFPELLSLDTKGSVPSRKKRFRFTGMLSWLINYLLNRESKQYRAILPVPNEGWKYTW